MNICQVLLSEAWGGAEAVAYQLTRRLTDKGENVYLILNHEMIKYFADLKTVTVYDVGSLWNPTSLAKSIVSPRPRSSTPYRPRSRLSAFLYAYSREWLTNLYFRRIETGVRHFLSDGQIDVLHAHLEDSISLVSRLDNIGIPRVATLHGEYALRGMSRIHPLMTPLARWQSQKLVRALDKMDMVTHVSLAFMEDSWHRWGDPLKKKSVLIHNGVSVSEIRECAESPTPLAGEFNLLFPGGPKFLKGGDLVIKAMAKFTKEIPGVHLYVALDVPQDHMLRRMVTHLGLEKHVTFSGVLPVRDYRILLSSVDVLVMPSRHEALALVYLEAMAAGKPVIATDRGGAPEIVKHGRNGLIVQPDPDEVANAILYLYRDDKLRKEMALNNLNDAWDHDWSVVADRYVQVYRDLTGRR